MNDILQVELLFTGEFLWKLLVIIIFSWFPVIVVRLVLSIFYPTDFEKTMKGMKGKFRLITKIRD